MIYLLCFALSGLFAALANRAQRRWRVILFSAISILLPVLLAGFRDFSSGTDTLNYLNQDYYWGGFMKEGSFSAYLDYYYATGLREDLFPIYVGSIAALTGNFRVFLLISHLIIITGVYVGAFRFKHHAQPELILLLFYLLYFNNSLNIMRQFMALAVVFAFFADLEKHELLYYLRYFLVVAIMTQIHSITMVFYVPGIFMLLLYSGKDRKPSVQIRTVILCSFIILVTVFFKPLVNMILDTPILSGRYAYYFNHAGVGQMSTVRLCLLLLELGGILLLYRKLNEKNSCFHFYLLNFIAFFAVQLLAPSLYDGRRLTLYFAFANMVTIAMLPPCLEKKWQRRLANITIICLATAYWYHTYVLGNASETFPYLSVFSHG